MLPILVSLLLFQTPPAANPIREGLAEYNKKNYARAVELLTKTISQARPGSPLWNEGVLALGQSEYLLGHFAESIQWLEKRAERKNRPEVEYMLGEAYLQVRKPEKARKVYAELFGTPPDGGGAYLVTAQMLMRNGMEAEAEKQLEKAVELDPKLPGAHVLLGEILAGRGELEAGLKHINAELTLNPAAAGAWRQLGEVYVKQEKWADAIRAFQKSVWLNPYLAPAYVSLGKSYMRVHSPGNAETMLRKAIQLDPRNGSAYNLLSQLLTQQGRGPEAQQLMREGAAAMRTTNK